MQRLILIFFIASELCYYLLIAQTGIVEYFSSNLFLIAPLPVGGVIGSLLISYINVKNKVTLFLIAQLILSFIYPNYNFLTLFILGFIVGSMAPRVINEVKKTHISFVETSCYSNHDETDSCCEYYEIGKTSCKCCLHHAICMLCCWYFCTLASPSHGWIVRRKCANNIKSIIVSPKRQIMK